MASGRSGGKNSTIKLAVAIGAVIIGVALPLYYFFGRSQPSPTPPTNIPTGTPEQRQEIEQYRENPPVPVENAGA